MLDNVTHDYEHYVAVRASDVAQDSVERKNDLGEHNQRSRKLNPVQRDSFQEAHGIPAAWQIRDWQFVEKFRHQLENHLSARRRVSDTLLAERQDFVARANWVAKADHQEQQREMATPLAA